MRRVARDAICLIRCLRYRALDLVSRARAVASSKLPFPGLAECRRLQGHRKHSITTNDSFVILSTVQNDTLMVVTIAARSGAGCVHSSSVALKYIAPVGAAFRLRRSAPL